MNDVRLYTRTERSEQAVATMGCVGCGAVCHVREFEGGESVERSVSVGVGVVIIGFRGLLLRAVLEACFVFVPQCSECWLNVKLKRDQSFNR